MRKQNQPVRGDNLKQPSKRNTGERKKASAIIKCIFTLYITCQGYMAGLKDHRRLFLADAFWDRSLCFPEAHSTVKIEICNFEKSVLLEQSTDRA